VNRDIDSALFQSVKVIRRSVEATVDCSLVPSAYLVTDNQRVTVQLPIPNLKVSKSVSVSCAVWFCEKSSQRTYLAKVIRGCSIPPQGKLKEKWVSSAGNKSQKQQTMRVRMTHLLGMMTIEYVPQT